MYRNGFSVCRAGKTKKVVINQLSVVDCGSSSNKLMLSENSPDTAMLETCLRSSEASGTIESLQMDPMLNTVVKTKSVL